MIDVLSASRSRIWRKVMPRTVTEQACISEICRDLCQITGARRPTPCPSGLLDRMLFTGRGGIRGLLRDHREIFTMRTDVTQQSFCPFLAFIFDFLFSTSSFKGFIPILILTSPEPLRSSH